MPNSRGEGGHSSTPAVREVWKDCYGLRLHGVGGEVMYERAILVVLGGLFGWILGKLPDTYVYVIAAVAVIAAIVVFGRG